MDIFVDVNNFNSSNQIIFDYSDILCKFEVNLLMKLDRTNSGSVS